MDVHTGAAATAVAQPNIALVKYWGKRDTALNLPAGGSISITLGELHTRTAVSFDATLTADEVFMNGAPAPASTADKVGAVIDLVRREADVTLRARVTSDNDFPTGAGLASSASGFAALVVAADAALGTALPRAKLSEFARRGSGSAARSVFGGFVELARGERPDGVDAVAAPVLDAAEWPLTVVIAVTSNAAKGVSSGAGMELSRRTSPFYGSWIAGNDAALDRARSAIAGRDFAALAEVSEASCTEMHAVMLATRPALIYWNGATVECLHEVRRLREVAGTATFFTVDAGPQVKAVCLPDDAARVAAALAQVPGVLEVRTSGLGAGARVLRRDRADAGSTGSTADAGSST
jgi:diphosphomevalonate decarboxylase